MRTAIYARKSNDDSEKSAEDKSVTRQITHARDFCSRRGWRAPDEQHIYVDDGISGGDFKRPGLLRMLNHLGQFDVIVMSEQSRLGREMSQMGGVIAKIVNRGVRVFFYLDGKELKYEGAVDKFMVAAVSFANEMERELASQRARDAALKRATERRNFGGRCYGYDNVWLLLDRSEQVAPPGEPKPIGAQTRYRINAAEAAVIVSVYEMYRDGHGAKSITYTLNCAPSHAALSKRYFRSQRPAPPRGQAACWSPNTIHDILRNPRFHGFIPYGATRRRLALGDGAKTMRAEEQLFEAPELRIIPPVLAEAVKQRASRMRQVYLHKTGGKLHGRPDAGRASKYLLSGLVRCEGCGSSMVVTSYGSSSGGQRRQVCCYVCNFRQNRGPTACDNTLRPHLERLDHEVLAAIERQVLTPEVVREAARRAVEMIRKQASAQPDAAGRLRRDLSVLERERDNLVTTIARGNRQPQSIVARIAEREQQVAAIRKELAQTEAPPLLDQLSDKRLERRFAERAREWRSLLAGDPALGREALRSLMAGPIWFVPQREGYLLRGATRLGALWGDEQKDGAGFPTRIEMASPRGDLLRPTVIAASAAGRWKVA